MVIFEFFFLKFLNPILSGFWNICSFALRNSGKCPHVRIMLAQSSGKVKITPPVLFWYLDNSLFVSHHLLHRARRFLNVQLNFFKLGHLKLLKSSPWNTFIHNKHMLNLGDLRLVQTQAISF